MTAQDGDGGPDRAADGDPRTDAGGHLGDLVADLADGRLAGADPALVLQHLDGCAACRADLADTVVAGAALRQLSESVRPPVEPTPQSSPPPDLPVAPRPAETTGPAADPRTSWPRHRVGPGGPAGRRRVGTVAGGALLALAVGAVGGIGAVEVLGRDPGATTATGDGPAATSAPSVPASASPSPPGSSPAGPTVVVTSPPVLDTGRTAGTVRAVLAGPVGGSPAVGVVVIGGSGETRRMALWTSGLRAPVGGEVYEVWLDGSTPLAVGPLDRAGSGSWVMATSVAAGRATVLVVRQRVGVSSPGAGDVVARATLF